MLKRKMLAVLLSVLLLVPMLTLTASATPAPTWIDDGVRADSFQFDDGETLTIMTAAEMGLLAYNCLNGADYTGYRIELGADIDLSGNLWVPFNLIGAGNLDSNNDSEKVIFFDGNDFTVSGMYVRQFTSTGRNVVGVKYENDVMETVVSEMAAAGFFSLVKYALVSDITFFESTIDIERSGMKFRTDPDDRNTEYYADTVGMIAGAVTNAKLLNCSVIDPEIGYFFSGQVPAIGQPTISVGGIAGYLSDKAFITFGEVNGGFINVYDSFDNFYPYDKLYVGGAAGYAYMSALNNTYANTTINYNSPEACAMMVAIGGLVGYISAINPIEYPICIINCFSRSVINLVDSYPEGFYSIGGIAGVLEDSALNNYFAGSFNINEEYEHLTETAALFGMVYSNTGNYDIRYNYFEDTIPFEPVGLVNPDEFFNNEAPDPAWSTVFSDKNALLGILNNNLPTIASHQENTDMTDVLRLSAVLGITPASEWEIREGVNAEYPIYKIPGEPEPEPDEDITIKMLIGQLKRIIPISRFYTMATWIPFENAFANAFKVVFNPMIPKSEIAPAYWALKHAIDNIERTGDETINSVEKLLLFLLDTLLVFAQILRVSFA